MRKLTDLNPRFVNAGGHGVTYSKTGKPVSKRVGVGMSFDCPCGTCKQRVFLRFENSLDGEGSYDDDHQPTWVRTGESFEDMTLKPSILRKSGCSWHGYLTNGVLKSV